jgi:hypothetical protein
MGLWCLVCKHGPFNVRFAPKATEVLRCRELMRCAATLRRVASVFETPLGSSRKASDFREEGLGGLNCPDGCVVLDR